MKIIRVEVAYADTVHVHLITREVAEGTTVRQAIECSGMLAECPEIDLDKNKVGIFSKVCSLDTVVSTDCRIEIYRPLISDPKTARRKRAGIA